MVTGIAVCTRDPTPSSAAAFVLNKTAFTIVGVTPPEFFGERVRRPPDFWVPLSFQPEIEARPSVLRSHRYLLAQPDWTSGASASRAQAQAVGDSSAATVLQLELLRAAGAGSRTADPIHARGLSSGATGISIRPVLYAQPLASSRRGRVGAADRVRERGQPALTRASARQGELSMRLALGAGRGG